MGLTFMRAAMMYGLAAVISFFVALLIKLIFVFLKSRTNDQPG